MARNKKEITIKILKIAGLGILIAAGSILAPKLPYYLLKVYLRKKFNSDYSSRQVQNAVYYLKRRKFVAYKNHRFIITALGEQFLKKYRKTRIEIKKTKWDNKWRFVTFDITESRLSERHSFRRTLKELGFYHFQRSVFAIPYPCEDVVSQIADRLNINEDVYVLTSDRFKKDKKLAKYFKLT